MDQRLKVCTIWKSEDMKVKYGIVLQSPDPGYLVGDLVLRMPDGELQVLADEEIAGYPAFALTHLIDQIADQVRQGEAISGRAAGLLWAALRGLQEHPDADLDAFRERAVQACMTIKNAGVPNPITRRLRASDTDQSAFIPIYKPEG